MAEPEEDPMTSTSTTYLVDADTVTVAFDDADSYDLRTAIDEIADRVEAEIERRGLTGEVEREYTATGRSSGEDIDPTVFDAVLVDGVDDLRAAVLG